MIGYINRRKIFLWRKPALKKMLSRLKWLEDWANLYSREKVNKLSEKFLKIMDEEREFCRFVGERKIHVIEEWHRK